MRELDIDVAGEFLHMAAQLVLMKSKLLLPRTEVGEDAQPEDAGVDPRAELVRRLLEYQKYRTVAEELARHDILDRNVFTRRARPPMEPAANGPEGLADVSIYKLIESLDRALEKASPRIGHEVELDRLSITDAISRVADALRSRRQLPFAELLAGGGLALHDRAAVIATFLAILEMARLRLVRVYQRLDGEPGSSGELVVEAQETLAAGAVASAEDYR